MINLYKKNLFDDSAQEKRKESRCENTKTQVPSSLCVEDKVILQHLNYYHLNYH